jgi:hypothetical protein
MNESGTTTNPASGNARTRTSKVERVMDRYGLEMGERLEELWVGEGENRSLRELAELFNVRVLEAAMREASVDTLEGEAENTYELLTEGDVSEGVKTQTRRKLERNDLDVDQLERDFVSHQAIYTYLTKYRGVEHSDDEETEGDPVENVSTTIQRLNNRTAAVVESNLERLTNADHIGLGEFDVSVEVRVTCEDCGTYRTVDELLAEGGCDCEN